MMSVKTGRFRILTLFSIVSRHDVSETGRFRILPLFSIVSRHNVLGIIGLIVVGCWMLECYTLSNDGLILQGLDFHVQPSHSGFLSSSAEDYSLCCFL
jgi:hypothetical protein